MKKSINAVIKANPDRKDIINAVIAQLDAGDDLLTTLSDVSSHGANVGFSGFTYYKETCEFYQANKDAIWDMATDQADELLGRTQNVFHMLAGFGGAKNVGSCDQFENLMAWYALEEVAKMFQDIEVEEED